MKKQDKQPKITVSKGGASVPKPNITHPVKLKDAHAVGKRIKYYRERQGLDQKDVAQAVGISSNAVSNWEQGRARPDFSVVPKLCETLEITLYELYGIDNPLNTYTAKEQTLINDYRGLNQGHQLTVDNLISSLKAAEFIGESPEVVKLIFCEKELAAGFDGGAEFEDQGEPIYLYPHTNNAIRQADLVFTVNGDSMEPEYHDGDMVLVEKYPGCPELQFGEVGAFMIGNSTYIKVLEEDGLHSFNDDYDTMHFSDDENVYLIGRVLGILEPESIASKRDAARYEAMHAIGDLPALYPLKNEIVIDGRRYSHAQTPDHEEVANHIPRFHNKRDIMIFKMLAEDIECGTNRYTSTEALKQLYTEMTGRKSNIHKYNVLRWNQQSNTIPAHLNKDGLRHIHPDSKQARSITVREAARLQSFSDDYIFDGSQQDIYKMIGNAVPPEFARRLALAVYDLLFRHQK